MIASVIKVDNENIILQYDEDDSTIMIPLEKFPEVEENGIIGIRNGQIFDIDLDGNIVFCKEETENRRAKVALRLAQLRRK